MRLRTDPWIFLGAVLVAGLMGCADAVSSDQPDGGDPTDLGAGGSPGLGGAFEAGGGGAGGRNVDGVTVRLLGDFARFASGSITLEARSRTEARDLSLTSEAATAAFEGLTPGEWQVSILLETASTENAYGNDVQEVQRAEGAIRLTTVPTALELNGVESTGALDWIGRFVVEAEDATALFPFDPCERFGALLVPAPVCHVDTDRGLYSEPNAKGDLLGRDFDQVEDCNYDGSNIFSEHSDGDTTFDETCASDAWVSADALSCFEDAEELRCIFFRWPNRE